MSMLHLKKNFMCLYPRYYLYQQFLSYSTQDCFTQKNLLQEFLNKKIMVIRQLERPRTVNTLSITFESFDPIEVSENRPIKESVNTRREKNEVCNKQTKEKPNSEENKCPMEIEVMETRFG